MQTTTDIKRARYLKKSNKAKGREERTAPEDIEEFLALTHESDADLRAEAVGALCPCHVQANHPQVWDRLFQLAQDPDVRIRKTVLHIMGDGSPREREADVVAAIETMYQDPDLKLRRHVRKLLASYRRTGRINVL